VGDRLAYDGHFYVVSGWIKLALRRLASRNVGPDNCPLVFCSREEAVYVTGSGVCGVIVRVTDVEIVGRVEWVGSELRTSPRSCRDADRP
jgi:hypothetical protein